MSSLSIVHSVKNAKGNTQIVPPWLCALEALEILGFPGLKSGMVCLLPFPLPIQRPALLHGAGWAIFGIAPLGGIPSPTDLAAPAGLADFGLQGWIVWQDGGAVVPAEKTQRQGLGAEIVQGQAAAVLPVKVGAPAADLPHHSGMLSRRQPEDRFTVHT